MLVAAWRLVLLGMYLRENRIDPEGIDQQRYKRSNGKKADEKPEPVSKEVSQPKEDKIKEEKTEVLPSNEPTLI